MAHIAYCTTIGTSVFCGMLVVVEFIGSVQDEGKETLSRERDGTNIGRYFLY